MNASTATLALLRARYGSVRAPMPAASFELLREVLAFAAKHGVGPMLADGVRRLADADGGWRALLPLLAPIELANTLRHQGFLALAGKLASAMASEGIGLVFLKGMAFLLETDEPGVPRTLTDIDVLVDATEVAAAAALLRANGFRQGEDLAGFAAGLHHHHPALHDDETGLFVELHARLAQYDWQNPVDAAAIFASAKRVTRGARVFSIPSATHRLIHLIAHAQLSNLGYALRQLSLRDAADTMELATHHSIDWTSVRQAFTRIGASREAMGFLLAVHQLLGLNLPYPRAAFGPAEKWAAGAVAAVTTPEHAGLVALRVVGHHLRLLVRHPSHLGMIHRTLIHPARLESFVSVNRKRLGLPER